MGLQAEMLGINHYYHESLEFNSQQHAFSILSMPIQKENGSPSLKHFLADTTFKQFCIDEFENIDIRSTSAQELSWGASLTKTPEGKRVADALLCQGYIEITPEIAELYIKSGLYKKDYAELDIPTNEILPKLLISTTDNDVFISDIVKRDYDLRPPSLVMSNAPLETMPTYRELRKPNLPAAESAIKSDSISFDVLTAFTGNLAEVVAIETLTSDVLDTFVVDTTNLPKTPKRISRMKK